MRFQNKHELNEKCGVFGIYGKDMDVARITYYGLWALQHRGQESSGIVSSDTSRFYSHIDHGLVAQVYDEQSLSGLKGHIAIGHNRYSTSGGMFDHLQPIMSEPNICALAHNGNLPSTKKLARFLAKHKFTTHSLNDSEMMNGAITIYLRKGHSLQEAISLAYPLFTGVFSCVVLGKDELAAFRDHCGIRPLVIGKLGEGYVICSETAALDTVGARYIRDVAPGELVIVREDNLYSYQLAEPTPKLESFEFIYFARPDSMLLGQSVNEVRKRLGARLAKEASLKADVVVPVPDSAIPAALGFAQASGIPFDHALIKNRYIHRTFITPTQKLRERDVQMKLNPLPDALRNKDVVVIDDSIVRGTTTKKIVRMLKDAGARKVHLAISSPPVKYPDFYGIDTPDQSQLIAAKLPLDSIRQHIGADSLTYLSLSGMIKAIGVPREQLCLSCFDGKYPISLHERAREVAKITHS